MTTVLYVVFAAEAGNLIVGETTGYPGVFGVSLGWKTAVGSASPLLVKTDGTTPLVISGWDFHGLTGISVGGTAVDSWSEQHHTRLASEAPAHAAGPALVQVTGTLGASADIAAAYATYVAPPTVTGLDVARGPVAGGTRVVDHGTNFAHVSGPGGVMFGGKNALAYTVDSDTQISATTPFHGAGTVQVKVTALEGSADAAMDDLHVLGDDVQVGGARECERRRRARKLRSGDARL